MKCEKHNYGYDDLPVQHLGKPKTNCPYCWTIYVLNNGNGEVAAYNMEVIEDAFLDFLALVGK